jgi:hypothetical protein
MRSNILRSLFFFITPLSGRGLSVQDVSSLIRTQGKIIQAGSLDPLSIKARRMSIKNYSDINKMDDLMIPPGFFRVNTKTANFFWRHPAVQGGWGDESPHRSGNNGQPDCKCRIWIDKRSKDLEIVKASS